MSFAEDILKLRKRIADAVSKGLLDEQGKDFFEANLIQVISDAEKNRQNCLAQADNLKRQASVMEGQAAAFASVTSIVWGVLNGFVSNAERDEAERLAEEAERAERDDEEVKESDEDTEEDSKLDKKARRKQK